MTIFYWNAQTAMAVRFILDVCVENAEDAGPGSNPEDTAPQR